MYLIMKKKIPRNAPWGELPGSDLGEEDAPLYVRIIDLPVRYEDRMRRSHQRGKIQILCSQMQFSLCSLIHPLRMEDLIWGVGSDAQPPTGEDIQMFSELICISL